MSRPTPPDPSSRRLGSSARWASAGLLAFLCGLPVSTAAGAQETVSPPEYRQMARDFLEELIEIDSNVDDGDITAAAEAMADRLRAAGFPEEDILVGGPTPTKGNLVVRYPGRDPGLEPLLALAHIDVVTADPADWTIPPYQFLERDGYFWGRGVTDDKDEAAIYIANLIRMKEEGYVPERGIVVALTADEEGGDHNGVVWLLENHRDWIDAAYALNEGGGGMERDGRKVSNNVQASEKVYQSFTLEATNPGGHSSLPVKKNAIYDLSRALLAVQEYDFPVMLNEVTEAYFTRTADIVGGELGEAMRTILADPTDPEALSVLAPEPQYNGRLRTTCVATQLQGGHAENALPQLARATVNCRIVPTQDPAEVQATLRELAGEDITVTPVQDPQPSPPSPLTDDVLGEIERITGEMWPGVPVLPIMSTGATDALYLRNAGIPVYGVSGLFHDVDDVRAHGQDERIRIEHFYEGQEFLYRLVKALTGGRVS
jgi:acetylornithine deacetylase/succinyl-diaminopimelate desuccinylase-like protein